MGLVKIIYYSLFTITFTFLGLNYMPNLLDVEPQSYTPKLMKYEGALAVNKDLDKAKIILENEVLVPESLAYYEGKIYASLANGKIVSIKDDKVEKNVADTAGWPLGIRFYKDELYVADIVKGLLKVDIRTGKVTVLVSPKEKIGGKTSNYPNDLDILDGVIYFSVSTTKWTVKEAFFGLFEHENSGRVLKHDTKTGKTEVLIEGLYYPNGMQITNDGLSVLVSEAVENRILRHHISGPKKSKTELFVELPGEPDNIRPSSTGGYWVALISSCDASSPTIWDRLATYPEIRKALARLSHLLGTGLAWLNQYLDSPAVGSISEEMRNGTIFLRLKNTDHNVVVEVDDNGKIVRSLHSENPKYRFLSQGLEVNGHLYLGSFLNPYILKLKL